MHQHVNKSVFGLVVLEKACSVLVKSIFDFQLTSVVNVKAL